MSKKVLVLGDSYATLDKNHGHWATLWANENNYDIDHQGYPGTGHIKIINSFLQKNITKKYDLIIYTMTDFLRAEINREVITDSKVIDDFFTHYDTVGKTDVKKDLSRKDDTKFDTNPGIMYKKFMTSKEDDLYTNLSKFYTSVSLNWLVSANMFALETLMYKCKDNNVPIILVSWPNRVYNVDVFPEGAMLFNIFNVNLILDIDEMHKDQSSNHITKYCHKQICTNFMQQYGDII
tara:strand:- start:352 stop:1059 length:708 start_codon:yes stop_codon:yes gene_type:complete